jgi:predicted MPP superfamily phosphohydrolase
LSLFFLTFFSIYGGAHLYFLLKARAALGFGWRTTAAVLPLLLTLALGPIIVYYLSKNGMHRAARAASWVGYVWMGLLFFFFWTNAALDLVNLAVRLVRLAASGSPRPAVPYDRATFFAMVSLALFLGGYSLVSAASVGVERVRIPTDRLPPSLPRVRIVQISDVHLGLMVRNRRAAAIARIVREASPDVLVSTGDLVDAEINHLEGLAEIFRGINPRLGKYAITGNHEYYAGIEQSLSFTSRSGFRLLHGESVSLDNTLRLAGVDDETAAAYGDGGGTSAGRALGGVRSPLYTVLLKHRPLAPRDARGLFDLQLSGHTHNGQIFPFSLVSRLVFPYVTGLYRLDGGAVLRVSRGTGTWGPPMRFLSPPEVTVIDIVRAP